MKGKIHYPATYTKTACGVQYRDKMPRSARIALGRQRVGMFMRTVWRMMPTAAMAWQRNGIRVNVFTANITCKRCQKAKA